MTQPDNGLFYSKSEWCRKIGFVSEIGSIDFKETASLPLVESFLLLGLSGKVAAMSGAKLFFNALLENFDSKHSLGNLFLISAFSFSRTFKRLASASLMRPYFLRHRWIVAMDTCFCLQNASWL